MIKHMDNTAVLSYVITAGGDDSALLLAAHRDGLGIANNWYRYLILESTTRKNESYEPLIKRKAQCKADAEKGRFRYIYLHSNTMITNYHHDHTTPTSTKLRD